jgi:hypothetical protein
MATFQAFAAGFVPSGTKALFMLFTTAKSTGEWKRVCANVFKMTKLSALGAVFVSSAPFRIFGSANGSKMTKFFAIQAFFVPSGTLALFMFFFTTPATFGFLFEFLEIVFLGIAFLEKIAPITLAFCSLFPEFLVVKADGWVWAGIQRMYRRHIVFISQ